MTKQYILTRDYTEPDGHLLPKGTVLVQHDGSGSLDSAAGSIANSFSIPYAFAVNHTDWIKPVEGKKRWWRGDGYHIIGSDGKIATSEDDRDSIDERYYQNGNYFRTQEEAEKYAKRETLRRKIQRHADTLNEGEKAVGGWYIYYRNRNMELIICREFNVIYDLPYYTTEEKAKQALDDPEVRDWYEELFKLVMGWQ